LTTNLTEMPSERIGAFVHLHLVEVSLQR
jgi:hypothetical protein